MTYFAGLDVSLRATNICVIDDQGELIAEGKTDADAADIVAFQAGPILNRPGNLYDDFLFGDVVIVLGR